MSTRQMDSLPAPPLLQKYPRHWFLILQRAFFSFLQSDCGNLSAAIAFYSLLSLFPLFMFLISLTGFFIREFNLQAHIINQVTQLLPTGSNWVEENLMSISKNFGRVQGLSLLLLWWSASGVFLPMESALNRAWRVTRGRTYWRRHLLALGMTLLCGTLLTFSLLATAIQRRLEHPGISHQFLPQGSAVVSSTAHVLLHTTPIVFSVLTFILIYQIVPNRRMRIREVVGGAVVSATLWEFAKHGFALLLPVFNYRHLYGSLSVAVALMMWGYVSSLILLFGAEIAAAAGTPPEPPAQ